MGSAWPCEGQWGPPGRSSHSLRLGAAHARRGPRVPSSEDPERPGCWHQSLGEQWGQLSPAEQAHPSPMRGSDPPSWGLLRLRCKQLLPQNTLKTTPHTHPWGFQGKGEDSPVKAVSSRPLSSPCPAPPLSRALESWLLSPTSSFLRSPVSSALIAHCPFLTLSQGAAPPACRVQQSPSSLLVPWLLQCPKQV